MIEQPAHIQEHVSLASYSTMRLGGEARYLLEVTSVDQLSQALDWAESMSLAATMIGGGSNTVFADAGYPGLVLINRIPGLAVEQGSDGWVLVTAGAGVAWDELVAYTVDQGLSGLETLSLVPGTVGAAPVQNIGAYGTEVDQLFDHLEALDTTTGQVVTLQPADCGFGYRSSWFQTTLKGRYLITSVTFRLQQWDYFNTPARREQLLIKAPYYKDVANYLAEHPVPEVTPAVIREAVMAVRQHKLPDPAVVANCGSFFHNPIISAEQFAELQASHPEIDQPGEGYTQKPYWPQSDGRVKLSAAWLIEHVGLRGYHDKATGMATSEKQALVVINEHAQSAKDLFTFRDLIVRRVEAEWGITLEQEPELVG